jgi:hypothetical protein
LVLENNLRVNNLVNNGTIYRNTYSLTIDGTSVGTGTIDHINYCVPIDMRYDQGDTYSWSNDLNQEFRTTGYCPYIGDYAQDLLIVENVTEGSVSDAVNGDMLFITFNVLNQGIDVGVGDQPPNNINKGDYLESAQINEIKDNADYLYDNIETCFNEKINLFSDRDTAKKITRYSTEFATRRDTVDSILNATNKDSNWSNVLYTAYSVRYLTRYGTKHGTADRNDCSVCDWAKTVAETSDWSVNNSPHNGTEGGCDAYYVTYHGGVDNTDRSPRDAAKYISYNSGEDATDHTSRHNVFCSILT